MKDLKYYEQDFPRHSSQRLRSALSDLHADIDIRGERCGKSQSEAQ